MPHPFQVETQPTLYGFKLGGFEVTTVLDSKVVREGLATGNGGAAFAGDVQALARANRIDPERYEHPFIPALVNTGRELVLFDTGMGALASEHDSLRGRLPEGQLVERMRTAGYRAEDVDVIVVTHGHPDHIGGLMKAGNPVFPNARYIFGAAEFDFWKRGGVREARRFNRMLFMKIAAPLTERATFVKPGDQIVPGITAVDAAGHSPGMMAYLIESEGKRVLNWADTCSHYVVSVQRPDIPHDLDDDQEKAIATRRRILEMAASDEMFVIGFHMPFPGIGFVERSNGHYRWVTHSYQLNL